MPQYISKIGFKNYKSFQEASIDIAPLSILVGANSTGKSALLKLLLLISQSLSSGSAALFYPNGPLVEMGDKLNIFPRYDKNAEMEFQFHYSEKIEFASALSVFFNSVRIATRRELAALDVGGKLREEIANVRKRLMVGPEPGSPDFAALRIAARLLDKYAERVEEGDSDEGESVVEKDFKGLGLAASLGERLLKSSVDSIIYKVRFSQKIDAPVIAKVIVVDENQEIMQYRPGDHKNMGERLSIHGVEQKTLIRYYRLVRQGVRSKSFRFFRRPARAGMLLSQTALINPVGFLIGSLLNHLSSPIFETFMGERVRHVSPLRAYPRRYYLLDGRDYQKAETERVIGLLRERPSVVNEVNRWLGCLGHSVKLEQLHDSIFRIMVNDGDLNADLTDVGFGLSQILPVILEPIISEPNDLIVIQQPEIHLHPKAQGILADFFVWAVKEKGCRLVVETHSEYLLRRLRRRIGEGVFTPELGTSISKDSVALMSIEKRDGVSVVNKLELNEVGDFKWPRDFLDDEVEDLLAFVDMTATIVPQQSLEGN